MVDSFDLFKKLGSGARFDLKRFKNDAEKFKISSKATSYQPEITEDAIEALDFFGNKTTTTTTNNTVKETKKKKKTINNETDAKAVPQEQPVTEGKKEEIKKKKKKKKRKHEVQEEEEEEEDAEDEDAEDEPEEDIEILQKKKKAKRKEDANEYISKERLAEKHRGKINLFRKHHRIHIHGTDLPDPIETFSDLERFGISSRILSNLQTNGYETPTSIQMQGIPIMLQKRELLACAPTGSGKTLAFILPLLHHLKEPKKVGFRAVVVSPTRELAQQIHREFIRMNEGIGLKIHVLSKAKASSNNFSASIKSKNFDILISTPNRLVHMLRQDPPAIELTHVEWLVLDEGDKLFEAGDAGFREQVASIFQACDNPLVRHTLFSATLANSVEEWCKLHLDNVVRLTVGIRNSATDTVEQELMFVGQESGKLLAMRQIILKGFQPPVLVFVQSKDRAKELFNELIYDGLNVDVIHADRTQTQRENVVKCFRSGKIWILIATELMGRGIDFKGVNIVVNYDFPPSAVSYIHRIGRTGRAGRKGKAITMFTEDDSVNLRSIANVMKASGCEIPEWMLRLKKPDRFTKKKLSKAPIKRECIKTISKYDIEKSKKRKQMIEDSKAKKMRGTAAAASKEI